MIKKILAPAYRALRGRDLDDDVKLRPLLGFTARKALEAIRGLLLGRCYTNSLLHFRGRSVRVYSQSQLSVGARCAFGDHVLIEANSINGIRIGDGVTLGRFAHVAGSGIIAKPGEGVRIGDRTAIGANNIIWGQGGVTIGSDCLLGPNVVLVSENHNFGSSAHLIREQGETRAEITIGDNCWLGSGVVVVAGVNIGSGCVIGAGSVVTRSIPGNTVAVGAPARAVRTR